MCVEARQDRQALMALALAVGNVVSLAAQPTARRLEPEKPDAARRR